MGTPARKECREYKQVKAAVPPLSSSGVLSLFYVVSKPGVEFGADA
jgi:hypothetical protein